MPPSFSKESFSGARLFAATPVYGELCTYSYLIGMLGLFTDSKVYSVPLTFRGIGNESLVQRARNDLVSAFLDTDSTHLLFVDADIGFKGSDVFSLLDYSLHRQQTPYEVVAGPYPKKKIAWDRIKRAVEQGIPPEDPEKLQAYGNEYTFSRLNDLTYSKESPIEVLQTGTGFMLIPKAVFLKFREVYPKQLYQGKNGKEQCAFFDCIIDPVTKRYLSEDYMFCNCVRKMGGRIILLPWIELVHQGSHTFEGSLSHLPVNAKKQR